MSFNGNSKRGNVIPLAAYTGKGNRPAAGDVRTSSDPLDGDQSARKGKVIPVDFETTQLQVLRYKSKKLEEAKLVLYKGSSELHIPVGSTTFELNVRILVKRSLVDYYFYCSRCGRKIASNVDLRAPESVESPHRSWKEIQAKVREDILKLVSRGEYPKCKPESD